MLKLLTGITMFAALLCAQSGQSVGQSAGQASGQPSSGQPTNRGSMGPMARGPRPWWDAEVARNLNLSEAQQKQVAQIMHEFRPRMREVQQAVNRADADVTASFNEEPVDQNKANDAINRLAAARADLTRAVSQADLKLRTVLTAQQWQEMRRPRTWADRPNGRKRGPSTATTPVPTTIQQK